MIAELALPRLGETMETGRVVAWLKQPGDRFARGETLVEIESDKTVVEMPALADGTLVEILVPAGEDADVGAPLCRYEDGGAAAPAAPAVQPAAPPTPVPAPSPAVIRAEPAPPRLRATPLARRLARQTGVALEGVSGSGRRGRIEAGDVRAARVPGGLSVAVPGGRIAYRAWGTARAGGETLMLLHGLAGDAQTWAGLAAVLVRQGAHAIAADLPGHGATTVAAAGPAAMAEAMAAFLAEAAPAPVHLVGHSLGAAVAARLARMAPAHVARLTLIAPAGMDREIDTDFVRGVVRARSGGALAHLLRRLTLRPMGLSPAQLDAMAAELAQGRLLALAEAMVDDGGQAIDITADLRALTVPARIVWGLHDRIIPWTQVRAAGHRAAVHLLAESGHVPHWDQPSEVASLLT